MSDTAEEASGISYVWKPLVLGIVIFTVFVPLFRWVRTPEKPQPVTISGPHESTISDLPTSDATKLGLFGARSPTTSAVGKGGDSLSARARVLNVFRMQNGLVAVTDASIFIHATCGDGLPQWLQAGKTIQIEGRITEVKTKTNVYVSATKLTAVM